METTIDFTKDIILENDRVLLRPLALSDDVHFKNFSTQEPEIWKFSLQSAGGPDNLQIYLDLAIKGRNKEQEYPFIVFDKVKNAYAGSTRFYDILPAYNTVQLGYTWYGKDFQGTGLNKNCKYLLLQFAFEQWNMERVEFRADNDNARSKAAMKSIGCKVDGVLRSNLPRRDGGRRDSIVLSILKDEWFGEVKAKIAAQIR